MIIVPEVPRLKKRLKTLIYVDKEQYHICILTVALVSKKNHQISVQVSLCGKKAEIEN